MSVSLRVWLKRPVPLVEIESSASAALRELLNFDRDPLVRAGFDISSQPNDFSTEPWSIDPRRPVCSPDLLSANSRWVLCSVEEHEEVVSVMPYSIPVQLPTDDGSYQFADGTRASIAWHFRRTPLCFALSAGVTLGLARLLDSEIVDTAGFFTTSIESTSDEFCRVLRLSTRHTDLESATSAFYARMSKSVQLTK
jgi:hypothetical protein